MLQRRWGILPPLAKNTRGIAKNDQQRGSAGEPAGTLWPLPPRPLEGCQSPLSVLESISTYFA